MPYNKSNQEIQNSAFALKSGNTTPFKMMGSSPLYAQDPIMTKEPVGPVTNDPMARFFPPSKPKVAKPVTKPNVSATNPNIVSEPVSTSVNMPNPNLKIDTESSKSTVKDVLMLPINVYTNPNRAIRTTQNLFTKVKKKVGEDYRKVKKKVKHILNKTI